MFRYAREFAIDHLLMASLGLASTLALVLALRRR